MLFVSQIAQMLATFLLMHCSFVTALVTVRPRFRSPTDLYILVMSVLAILTLSERRWLFMVSSEYYFSPHNIFDF